MTKENLPLDHKLGTIDAPIDPMGWIALFNIVAEKASTAPDDNNAEPFHPRNHTRGIVTGLKTLTSTLFLVAKPGTDTGVQPPTAPDTSIARATQFHPVHLDELEELVSASDILSKDTVLLIRDGVRLGLTQLRDSCTPSLKHTLRIP